MEEEEPSTETLCFIKKLCDGHSQKKKYISHIPPSHPYRADFHSCPFQILNSGFGGLEVVCWPLVPKFAGSNPAKAVRFLRVKKNPQHVGGHGCLSVVIVVCCQVEVSATN